MERIAAIAAETAESALHLQAQLDSSAIFGVADASPSLQIQLMRESMALLEVRQLRRLARVGGSGRGGAQRRR